jgi:hypothetical protein
VTPEDEAAAQRARDEDPRAIECKRVETHGMVPALRPETPHNDDRTCLLPVGKELW